MYTCKESWTKECSTISQAHFSIRNECRDWVRTRKRMFPNAWNATFSRFLLEKSVTREMAFGNADLYLELSLSLYKRKFKVDLLNQPIRKFKKFSLFQMKWTDYIMLSIFFFKHFNLISADHQTIKLGYFLWAKYFQNLKNFKKLFHYKFWLWGFRNGSHAIPLQLNFPHQWQFT